METDKTMVNVSLPSEMIYAAPTSRRAMISRRENVFKNCDGTSSGITPNSVITFTIPPTNTLIVPQETYFTLRVRTLPDATPTSALQGNVQRILQRVRIMNTNGEILEDITNYNLLNEIIQDAHFNEDHQYDYLQPEGVYQKYGGTITAATLENGYSYDDFVRIEIPFDAAAATLTAGVLTPGVGVFNTGLVSLGDIVSVRGTAITHGGVGTVVDVAAGTITLSNIAAAQNMVAANFRSIVLLKPKSTYFQDQVQLRMNTGSGKLFSFQLRGSGIMMMDKYLPMQHIGGLRIEFTLENQATALVGPGAPNYVVNDPRIYYTLLTPSDQLAATLSKAARSGKMNFTYNTFDNRQYTIDSPSIAVELTKPLFRVNNVFMVKRASGIVSSVADNSFVINSTGLYGTDGTDATYYQFTFNSIYFPVDRVNSFERSYKEMVKSVGQLGDIHYAVPFRKYKSPFNDSKFVIGQSFELMHEADAFSGSSTKNNKSIIFNMERTGGVIATRYDFFTYYLRNISLLAGGQVQVSE